MVNLNVTNIIEVTYKGKLQKPKFYVYPSTFQAVLKDLQKDIKAKKIKEFKVVSLY